MKFKIQKFKVTGLGLLFNALLLLLPSSSPVIAAEGQGGQTGAKNGAPDPMAIARGAKAWADNCARCHRMREPQDYRDDLWKPVVFHMRMRAGLTGQETRDILEFLKQSN